MLSRSLCLCSFSRGTSLPSLWEKGESDSLLSLRRRRAECNSKVKWERRERNTFCVFSAVGGWGRAFLPFFRARTHRAVVVIENYTAAGSEGGPKSCPDLTLTQSRTHTDTQLDTKESTKAGHERERERAERLMPKSKRRGSSLFSALCVVVKRRKRHEKNRLINYC